MTAPIRLLLVDDNYLTRVGTVTLVSTEPGFVVAGEAEDGAEGVALYRSLRPDVVVLDLRMPKLDGVAVAEALAKETPPARILILTHYDGDENVFRALRAGALGYLTKDVRGPELFAALRTVARGERSIPAQLAGKIASNFANPVLSAREYDVLAGIYAGASNKDIAAKLSLSEKTVAMHLTRMFAKLGVKSRTEAISVALKRGILRAP